MPTTSTSLTTMPGVTLASLTPARLRALLESQQYPSMSVLMPTHRRAPHNSLDRGTYSGLVDSLSAQLAAHGLKHDRRRLVEPLRSLEYDPEFWQATREGLAVYAREGQAEVFCVRSPLPLRAVLGHRFCTLPLIPLVSFLEHFDVLALTSRVARIYSGTLDSLEPFDLPRSLHSSTGGRAELHRVDIVEEETREPHRVRMSHGFDRQRHGGFRSKQEDIDADTERFFREVDREVFEQVSRQTHRPLFLVALGEHAAVFRHLSKNPFLQEWVARDPLRLHASDLANVVEPLVRQDRQQRMERLLQAYAKAVVEHRASSDLAEVSEMARAGRVKVLLVEAGRAETGVLEQTTQDVVRHGGDVIALPPPLMPNSSGLAAICRY